MRYLRPRIAIAAALVLTLGATFVAPAAAHSERIPFKRKDRQARGPSERPYDGLAKDRRELRDLWDHFNQAGDPPFIGFKRNVAVLVATFGSSSCPAQIHDVRLNRDKKVLVVRVYDPEPPDGGGCTDDIAPFTRTISVARADLNPLKPRQLEVRRRYIDDPNS